jgi:hypothetical protein
MCSYNKDLSQRKLIPLTERRLLQQRETTFSASTFSYSMLFFFLQRNYEIVKKKCIAHFFFRRWG